MEKFKQEPSKAGGEDNKFSRRNFLKAAAASAAVGAVIPGELLAAEKTNSKVEEIDSVRKKIEFLAGEVIEATKDGVPDWWEKNKEGDIRVLRMLDRMGAVLATVKKHSEKIDEDTLRLVLQSVKALNSERFPEWLEVNKALVTHIATASDFYLNLDKNGPVFITAEKLTPATEVVDTLKEVLQIDKFVDKQPLVLAMHHPESVSSGNSGTLPVIVNLAQIPPLQDLLGVTDQGEVVDLVVLNELMHHQLRASLNFHEEIIHDWNSFSESQRDEIPVPFEDSHHVHEFLSDVASVRLNNRFLFLKLWHGVQHVVTERYSSVQSNLSSGYDIPTQTVWQLLQQRLSDTDRGHLITQIEEAPWTQQKTNSELTSLIEQHFQTLRSAVTDEDLVFLADRISDIGDLLVTEIKSIKTKANIP